MHPSAIEKEGISDREKKHGFASKMHRCGEIQHLEMLILISS
jgi:hypothetical protein